MVILMLLNGYGKIDIHVEDGYIFKTCCRLDRLDVAKWLLVISKGKIDIHAGSECAFGLSCENGHLDVAKWLWDLSNRKINIHAGSEYAFKESCEGSHLDVVKWLRQISNCTINESFKPKFISPSFLKRYLSVVRYLRQISNCKIKKLNVSVKKYRYQNINQLDNLHMLHHYYKPIDGPGYLYAIN